MGNDEILILKEDMKDNIKEIKETINRLEDNTNKSLKEFGEQTYKSIEKLSDVVQEFKLVVTKEYIDKTQLNQCMNKIEIKVDKHIEDDQKRIIEEKNTRWKLYGLLIGIFTGITTVIQIGISYFKG